MSKATSRNPLVIGFRNAARDVQAMIDFAGSRDQAGAEMFHHLTTDTHSAPQYLAALATAFPQ